MNYRAAAGVLLALLLGWARAGAVQAVEPWQADIERFAAEDAVHAPPSAPIVFVGSSSIRMWPDLAADFPGLPVLNRGFGGSRLADAERLADVFVLRYAPSRVVVYAGDNDLAEGLLPAQVAADFASLVRTLRADRPALPVVFISIKPSLARAILLPQMREANRRIRAYTEATPGVEFVDVFTPILDVHGRIRPELFGPDGLHMNAEGYRLWQARIAPFLR